MQGWGEEREVISETEPKKVPGNVKHLQEMVREQIAHKGKQVPVALDDYLWEVIVLYQGALFMTAKRLEFSYSIRGHEMFVTRKDKSITKATVLLAFHKAIELQQKQVEITGPKKLGTFGASYLYPIFLEIGIIWRNQQISFDWS